MKIFIKMIILIFGLVVGSELTFASNANFDYKDIPIDKVWTIIFSDNVATSTINYENIYIKDIYGDDVLITLNTDFSNQKKVYVTSRNNYKYDMEYTLYITGKVQSRNGKALNQLVTTKFKTIKNPNFGDLSKIVTADDLIDYLNTNYSVLDTPFGKWEMKYNRQGSPATKLIINTSWTGGSPYTLKYDDDELETLEYGRPITDEEARETKRALRELQFEIASIASTVFPTAPIEGGYHESGYKYPNLQIDYWSIPFLSWKNYYGDAYNINNKEREFNWNPRNDDYNFVLDTPIKKIYVVDEKNNRQFAYEDSNRKIVIKKGEKIKFSFDQDVDINLSNYEIGLSYFYNDYSNKKIITVDERGNILGNKVGEQSVSVSYRWDTYVTHYFTIIVEE